MPAAAKAGDDMHPITAEFLATSHLKDLQGSRHWPASNEEIGSDRGRPTFEVARQRVAVRRARPLSAVVRALRAAIAMRVPALARLLG